MNHRFVNPSCPVHQILWAMLVFGMALCAGVASTANVEVDWSNTFVLKGSWVEDPLVRVGFNPQPEPPAAEYHPTDPGMDNPAWPGVENVAPLMLEKPMSPASLEGAGDERTGRVKRYFNSA